MFWCGHTGGIDRRLPRASLNHMAKDKTQYTCNACGAVSPKWLGKCQECGAWNSLAETRMVSTQTGKNRYASLAGETPVTRLDEVEATDFERSPTGIPEFDRVLGGGIVQGGVTLLAGEPGVGKSTLLLQAMDGLHRQGKKVLYISGEEAVGQVGARAKRLGIQRSSMLFQAEIQLERILESIDRC